MKTKDAEALLMQIEQLTARVENLEHRTQQHDDEIAYLLRERDALTACIEEMKEAEQV